MTVADPGATPTSARALAPDLARGGMLLLIALANVHQYLYGRPPGVRGYPGDLDGAERVVVLLQMTLVDGRAYPLFGLLFGYGVVQLAWRRAAVGLPADAVTGLVRRRGGWMIAIGFAHGLLLWSGDIVGAYGLLALIMAGLLVRGSNRGLVVTTVVGVTLVTLISAPAGLPADAGGAAVLASVSTPDPAGALLLRAFEWLLNGLLANALGVFPAVVLGAWAARRRILDEPERHRRLLVWVGVLGLPAGVLGGLPFGLMADQSWTEPPLPAALAAAALHALAGYSGALGYAALFALVTIRLARSHRPDPLTRAVQACGQRSLSCYLAQSLAFVALFPAWTLGLGAGAEVWQLSLAGLGAWLVILLVAAVSDRAGHRGPAERLLRRLTYGPRAAGQPA